MKIFFMEEMMEKKVRTKIVMATVIAVALVVAATGCSLLRPSELLVGTWLDVYDGKRVITETTVSFYFSSTDTEPTAEFDIVDFARNSWNGGDIGEGEHGYMVLECTSPPSWNTDQAGTYTVFRWQNLATVDGEITIEFAEGSPPTWPTGYGATAAEAAESATEANGWFGFGYTSGTKQ